MNKTTLAVLALIASVAGNVQAGGSAENGKALAATCAACHGADGQSTIDANPKLAGQHESYLVQALRSYRDGSRTNPIMAGFAAGLSDQDIKDLAAWFSSQTGDMKTAR